MTATTDPLIVYYSGLSQNTYRFVEKLGVRAVRIPVSMRDEQPQINEPYVLICPTYADDDGSKAVPKQVIHFLNDPHNRFLLKGVIGAGNRNFGDNFVLAGKIIAKKCNVPLLYRFELSGMPEDVFTVRQGIDKLWATMTYQGNNQNASGEEALLQRTKQTTG